MGISVLTACVVSFISFIAFFGFAFLSAQLISFKPDNSDHTQRKMWFWIIAVVMVLCAVIVNLAVFYAADITNPTVKNSYFVATGIGAFVILLLYGLLGLFLSKKTHGKLASWFN
ncbi:MAG: hypothetical protein HDS64_05155 [Bacteroidales bacterium]|nr:hypothetical protein [Bacteroidales bacterium]